MVVGRVNCMVDMQDKHKRYRTFHVNMLRQWHVPCCASYISQQDVEEESGDILTWRDDVGGVPTFGLQLTDTQREKLQTLLAEYRGVVCDIPGHMTLVEHRIKMHEEKPIHLQPIASLYHMCTGTLYRRS